MSKIEYIDYAIAFKVGKIIYLNKNLDNFPELKEALIKHEQAHSNYPNEVSWKDICVDFRDKHLKGVKWKYYKFLFTQRKAWMQFLPVFYIKKRIVFDPVMLLIWLLAIFVIIILPLWGFS